MEQLCLTTYNLKGYNPSKVAFLSNVLDRAHFVCVQEHWLMKEQFSSLFNDLDCSGHCISAMESDTFYVGRPFGGIGILWKKNLSLSCKPIEIQSKEICAIEIQINRQTFGIFNVYMPCDRGSVVDDKFSEILDQIRGVWRAKSLDFIIMVGDLNTDLTRQNSFHTLSLINFAEEESLNFGLRHPIANVDYTYESASNNARSLLDHVIVSANIFQRIIEYSVHHSVDNLSDHDPVTLEMKLETECLYTKSSYDSFRKRFDWKRAGYTELRDYQGWLDNLLSVKENFASVDAEYDFIVNCCITAAERSIPVQRKGKKKMYNWDNEVKAKREKAIFWHKLWVSNNRPTSGWVFEIRKNTRREYHIAVKNIMKTIKDRQASVVVEKLQEGKNCDFWREIKKISGKNTPSPAVIDDTVDVKGIADLFAEKYNVLFNSVGYTGDWALQFEHKVDSDFLNNCKHGLCLELHLVSKEDVKKHVKTLHPCKADYQDGMSSDNLKYGSDILMSKLANLFTNMLQQGQAPVKMNKSCLVPIPKDNRKSLNQSSNYRSIAISSIILKVMEKYILEKNSELLSTSDLQFGFKENHSTAQCTFVLQEIVYYHISRNTKVYAMFLDCSKAFDRLNYEKMFELLYDKGMCSSVLKLLWSMYRENSFCVRWKNCHSSVHGMKNGVKQGGILSPKMFILYLDDLFVKLKSSGLGCHINGEYCGILGYADDLTLLATSKEELGKMLEICVQFAKEFDLLFNPSKSTFLVFSTTEENTGISFDGMYIKNVQSVKHLGHVVNSQGSVNVDKILSEYTVKVNAICNTFKHLPFDVLYRLGRLNCFNLYGCELWRLSKKVVDRCNVVWRKSVRKFLKIPYRSHSKFLPFLVSDFGIEMIVFKRILNFFQKCKIRNNSVLMKAIECVEFGYGSDLHESLRFLCNYFGLSLENVNVLQAKILKDIKMDNFVKCLEGDDLYGNFLCIAIDCLYIRDYYEEQNFLLREEANAVLKFVLCS